MGFWDDLKQLGRDLGGELSNLGSELKEIGKETVEEIKQDPAKYIKESAKEAVVGVAKVGRYVYEEGVPTYILSSMKEAERRYQNEELTDEQQEKHIANREKGAAHGLRELTKLISKPAHGEWSEEDISRHIRRIENSSDRLEWFLRLKNPGLSEDIESEAKDALRAGRERIRELKKQRDRAKQEGAETQRT